MKIILPATTVRTSGGGAEVNKNFMWAEKKHPSLFCDSDSMEGINIVMQNKASLSRFLKKDYIILPQNAWPWIGNEPCDFKWKAKKNILKTLGESSMKRATGIIRLSSDIPDFGRYNKIIPNVLSETFDSEIENVKQNKTNFYFPYVYSFGNFIDYRGYIELIEKFDKLDEDRTLILQGGVLSNIYYKKCLEISNKSRNKIVLLADRASRAEILTNILHSDIVIFPSTAEASPISLLEAIALNKKVICNNIGGHRQEIPRHIRDYVIYENRSFSSFKNVYEKERNEWKDKRSTVTGRSEARTKWISEIENFLTNIPKK